MQDLRDYTNLESGLTEIMKNDAQNRILDTKSLLAEIEAKNAIVEAQRKELERWTHLLDVEFNENSRELNEAQIRLREMVARLSDQRDSLERLANTDPLTELYNHRYFQQRLATELARAKRYQHSMSVLLIDVDKFKLVNDKYGHPSGDFLLQQTASILKSNLRQVDILARYGGDEFAAILPETQAGAAYEVAEKLRKAIEEARFSIKTKNGRSRSISVTLTIGVSSFPDHAWSCEGLVLAADSAMYSGKHISRNRASIYTSILNNANVDEVREIYRLLQDPAVSAVKTLAATVDGRDGSTMGHSERVTNYALGIARKIGLSPMDEGYLQIAGLLHDVGKLGIPDDLLFKPGSLTSEELKHVQYHSVMGKNILERIPQVKTVLPIVLHHHERWDGKGYPYGIAGEEIPVLARILTVADCYDAITSDRPYRKAMTQEDSFEELRRNSGTQFAHDVVDALIASIEEKSGKVCAA